MEHLLSAAFQTPCRSLWDKVPRAPVRLNRIQVAKMQRHAGATRECETMALCLISRNWFVYFCCSELTEVFFFFFLICNDEIFKMQEQKPLIALASTSYYVQLNLIKILVDSEQKMFCVLFVFEGFHCLIFTCHVCWYASYAKSSQISCFIWPFLGNRKNPENVIFHPICFLSWVSCREKLSTPHCIGQLSLPHVKMSALTWHAEVTYQQVRGQRQIARPTHPSLVGDQWAPPCRLCSARVCFGSLFYSAVVGALWENANITYAQLGIRLGNRKWWRDLSLPVVFSTASSAATPLNMPNYSQAFTLISRASTPQVRGVFWDVPLFKASVC